MSLLARPRSPSDPHAVRNTLAWLTAALTAFTGCGRQSSSPRYETLVGQVLSIQAETGELTARVMTPSMAESAPTLHCVVTRDTEIYVNDRAASIRDVSVGDRIELVGYRAPDPRVASFVVSFAFVDHPLTWPPPPELEPAAGPTAGSSGSQAP
jgi:hypothetical protein